MKNTSMQVYKLATLLVLLLFVNCQKEEFTKELQTEHQEQIATRNTVSSGDIPEVMEFLRSKSNDKLEFKFSTNKTYSTSSDPHENDIVITQAMEDQIVQVVKDGKSNYAFKTKEKFPNYFLNLIVVQTNNGYYMYFAKYVPNLESNWDGTTLETFEGIQYVYSDIGKFREKSYYSNGTRGLVPCPCPSDDDGGGGAGGGDGCNDETWYICGFRSSLHQYQTDCNCFNSSEGCSGFYPIEVSVCTGINPTTIESSEINLTASEECYCWVDEGSTVGNGGGTGGGNNNNCPNAQPCANELEELNEFCECEFAINPITPINPSPNMAKDINICLGSNFSNDEINTLNANPTIDQLYNYVFDDFGNCNPENPEFAELAAEALLEDNIVDYELEMIIEVNETLEFQSQTCLKEIKDDVIKTEQLSKIIKKFEPTYPVLHLEWGIFNNTNWGNTGNTGLNAEQDTAFINLNSESIPHVTNIVMAKTIAHELIHAELYRKLKELVDDYSIISLEEYLALQDNFLGIADYTFRYGDLEFSQDIMGNLVTWGLYPDYSLAHHNQMAAFYRQTLIDVMKAYDLSKGVTRPNADEFYEALSWAGLRITSDNNDNSQYTDAWINFKNQIDIEEADIPESERTYNRYINIMNQEYNSNGINCD